MPVPSPRNSIRIARGNFADLNANSTAFGEGEFIYAIDQDRFYTSSGGVLVAVGAGTVAAQGLDTLADVDTSTIPPGVGQVLKWDGTNWVPADDSNTDAVTSVAGKTGDVTLVKADITDFADGDYATATQGALADSATQPGDNISTLTNDAAYITSAGAPVQSVAGKTGDVTLVKGDVGLGNVDNTSDANKPISTATQSALNLKADLVGGVVPNSQLPSLAITEYLGTVASEAALLALSGQRGDWAIRTDTGSTWVITTDGGSTITDWTELATPADAVTSVNGFTGAVVLGPGDVGAATAAQGALADTAVQRAGDTMTGALGMPVGSDASPSVYFDANTGLYSPGADQVAISTNGTGRLFVDASGKVGVGVSSFTTGEKLKVIDGSSGATSVNGLNTLVVEDSGDGGIAILNPNSSIGSIAFGDNDNGAIGRIRYLHSSDAMLFQTNGSESLRITSDGKLGLGTSNPSETLEVAGNAILDAYNATLKIKGGALGTTGAINFTFNTDATVYGGLDLSYDTRSTVGLRLFSEYPLTIESDGAQPILFKNGTSERARIDSSGRLLVGTSSAYSPVGFAHSLQIEGTASTTSSLSITRSDTTTGGTLTLAKANGGIGGNTAVTTGEALGQILFNGSNGTNRNNYSARILAEAESTFTTSSCPATLSFWTTASGASTPTERMRITSDGKLGLGTSTPATALDIAGSSPAIQFTDTTVATTERNWRIIVSDLVEGDFNIKQEDGNDTNTYQSRFYINSSGNVGIGTVSPGAKLQVNGDILLGGTSDRILTNNIGIVSSAADLSITSSSANLLLKTGASNDERARIDTSGRLLVGTSSYAYAATLVLQGNSSASNEDAVIRIARGATPGANSDLGLITFEDNSGNAGASIRATNDTASSWGSGDYPGRLVFSTTADGASSPTERMRISSNGGMSAYTFSTDGHGFRSSQGSSTSHILIGGLRDATSTQNGTFVFVVRTNGQVENSTGSYGVLSDVKLKENIVDANSQWQDIKSLRIVNYNFKEETGYDTHNQLGVIAQEVELISPGLISESIDKDEEGNNLGTTTKSVKSSILYMKAVKALQEAMERIETLEQRLNDAGL
jgi:hypothetical protein